MNLNKKFGRLFDTIISKEKRTSLFEILQDLYENELLNQELILCLIKSLILVLSYYPHKIDTLIEIITSYKLCNIELHNDLSSLFKKMDLSYQFLLPDNLIDNIIFDTIHFFELFKTINIIILYKIWFEILSNSYKINKNDIEYKINIYLFFIKESKKIINVNKNHFYLKITKLCGSTSTMINEYMNRK